MISNLFQNLISRILSILERIGIARLLTILGVWLMIWTFGIFPYILERSSMKSDDSFGYVTSAYNIYDGKGMRLGPEYDNRETAYWAPLVPYLIAWTSKLVGFKTIIPMKFLNICLVLLSCFCLIRLAAWDSNIVAGKLASVLCCLYIPLLTYVGRVNYTVVNVCLFVVLLIAITGYLRKPGWTRLGIIAIVQGVMFYNLGTSLLLIPFIIISIWTLPYFKKRQNKFSLYLFIPWLVAILFTTPWVIRNYKIFKRPIFVQMSGYTIFEGNKATKHFFDDPWSYGKTEPMIHRVYIHPSMRELGVSTYEEWDFHSHKLGLKEILDDPLIQIKKMLIMSVAFWYYAMTPFHSLIYAIYAIPLIFGFIIYCRKKKVTFEIGLFILGSSYFYIFCIMTTAQARYSLPCIPILMLTFSIVLLRNRQT
jgi:hypothetical protein